MEEHFPDLNAMKRVLRSRITLAVGAGLSGLILSKCVYDYSQKHRKHYEVHAAENGMTLKSVQVFFRHGARTPMSQLPNVEEVRKLHSY